MKTENFEYKLAEVTFRGYLAYDETKSDKRPGILVAHEAWGLGDHAKNSANHLAKLGYVVLAVDMFGNGKQAGSVEEGLEWTKSLRENPNEARARIRAAFDALSALPQVDKNRIAGIGYCFGGTAVLELARSGAPLSGVVSFHGALQTQIPAQPDHVKAKLLICTGAEDPFIPLEQVNTFIDEMKNARVDYQVIIYGDTKHGFTNPEADKRGMPQLGYNKSSDQRSWAAMQSFFHEIFGTTPATK